jgi:hypothetical protein
MDLPVPIVAALITLVGSVILAPFASRLINGLLDRRSKLLAKIMISGSKLNPIIAEILEERPTDNRTLEQLIERSRLVSRLVDRENYILIKLTNNSTRKIPNLTLKLNSQSDYFAKIDGNLTTQISGSSALAIGDLQPKREVEIQLWVPSFLSSLINEDYFKFSADELHGTRIQFPLPLYQNAQRRKRFGNVLVWIFCIVTIVALLSSGVKFKP